MEHMSYMLSRWNDGIGLSNTLAFANISCASSTLDISKPDTPWLNACASLNIKFMFVTLPVLNFDAESCRTRRTSPSVFENVLSVRIAGDPPRVIGSPMLGKGE